MGLDCSHDAFHGAYSAFNRLRQFICAAIEGTYPPHWIYSHSGTPLQDDRGGLKTLALSDKYFFLPDIYSRHEWPGLYEFLLHSDCDGEIDPETCLSVANDLERLMPQFEALRWESVGHIANRGGYVEVVRKFIAGCRAAAAAGESLRFR